MLKDEEYLRYKEEMANTLKMSMILKSLNTNHKKSKKGSKSLAVSASGANSKDMAHLSSGSLGSRTRIGGTGANTLGGLGSGHARNQDINEL